MADLELNLSAPTTCPKGKGTGFAKVFTVQHGHLGYPMWLSLGPSTLQNTEPGYLLRRIGRALGSEHARDEKAMAATVAAYCVMWLCEGPEHINGLTRRKKSQSQTRLERFAAGAIVRSMHEPMHIDTLVGREREHAESGRGTVVESSTGKKAYNVIALPLTSLEQGMYPEELILPTYANGTAKVTQAHIALPAGFHKPDSPVHVVTYQQL